MCSFRFAYAAMNNGDWGGVYHERGEIFDIVREGGITGFAIVSGDRRSFWAGYAAKALPPAKFEPVGITFVGGSITSPGMQEAHEHGRRDNPLRKLFIADREDGSMEPTMKSVAEPWCGLRWNTRAVAIWRRHMP